MAEDFKLGRIGDIIKKLRQEQEQLRFSLTKLQRNEQAELERVRREFKTQIYNVETRQNTIISELRQRDKEYKQIEIEVNQQKLAEDAEKKRLAEEEKRRRLHL